MEKFHSALVIDDSPIDRFLATRVLETLDICSNILTTASGMGAFRIIDEYFQKQEKLPDLIMVDIQLPVMNGFEIIRRIKQESRYKEGQTQIILVTAGLDEVDMKEIEILSIGNVLFKPLDKNELLNMLRKK
jgi:two-component system, sensor histidine kinase